MSNKRGIVTTFIILGILIVSLTIGIYFTKDYILRSEWQRLREQPVPEKARDVKDFVSSCVKEVGEEAVRLVGMQAGYVDVPGDPIELSRLNIFSNGLVVGGSLKVPYWLYEQSNGITKEQMPSLDKIESEISNYVNNNLKTCLGGFEGFKNYNIRDAIVKTETEVQSDRILISVNYPLHIELKDFYFDFTGFYERVDAPLGELYDVAKNIYYKEKNEMFLEENTLDWMGQYDEIPTSGVEEKCVPSFWIKEKVISDFKNILFNNIQFLKLRGSNYVLTDESHERFVLDAFGKDIDANFMFSNSWPFDLEVVPEENGLLRAQSLTEGLGAVRGLAESFVCLSTWHFVYNIKYPVLVSLSKDDYTFQFALQVVIDRNEPRKSEVIPLASSEETDKRVCENIKNEITVYTTDDAGTPLGTVDVSYKCITHTCSIGTTKLDVYDDASFTEKFPLCVNGVVLGSKKGYHTAREIISTTKSGSLTLELEPYRKLDVDIVVQRAGSGEIREGESVFISMEEPEKEYGVFVTYPDQKEINLIPGNYKVRIFIMSNYPGGIDIPSRTVQSCTTVPSKSFAGIFGEKEEHCVNVKMPGMKLDQAITGNVEYDLFISRDDLDNKKIIFSVPYKKPTDLSEYTEILTPSKDFVKPKFENV